MNERNKFEIQKIEVDSFSNRFNQNRILIKGIEDLCEANSTMSRSYCHLNEKEKERDKIEEIRKRSLSEKKGSIGKDTKSNLNFKTMKKSNMSIQKSREYTSKFHDFNSKVKYFDMELIKLIAVNSDKEKINKEDNSHDNIKNSKEEYEDKEDKNLKERRNVKEKSNIIRNHTKQESTVPFSFKFKFPFSINFKFNNNTTTNIVNTNNSNAYNDSINNKSSSQNTITETRGITLNQIEFNLRVFQNTNPLRFSERIQKGPPKIFRWTSWLIALNVPEKRSNSIFHSYYLSHIKDELQIKKDLNRTIPEGYLKLFNEKEIAHMEFSLYQVLKAISAFDPELSYCQGMNFITSYALYMSNYNETDTFYFLISIFCNSFSNNNNNLYGARGYYLQDFPLLNFHIYLFYSYLEYRNPLLYKHIKSLSLNDNMWIGKWIMTFYTIVFPLEIIYRIWDYIVINGIEYLVKFSICLIEELQEKIFKCDDTDFLKLFEEMSPFYNEDLIEIEDKEELTNQEKTNKQKENHIIKSGFCIKIEDVLFKASKINFKENDIEKLKVKYEKIHTNNVSKTVIRLETKNEIEKILLNYEKNIDTLSYSSSILGIRKENDFELKGKTYDTYGIEEVEIDCEGDAYTETERKDNLDLKIGSYNFKVGVNIMRDDKE